MCGVLSAALGPNKMRSLAGEYEAAASEWGEIAAAAAAAAAVAGKADGETQTTPPSS